MRQLVRLVEVGLVSPITRSTASEAIGMISGGRPSVAHREEYRQ